MNHRTQPLNAARQSGLALVIVIWILTLLTLMAGSFAMSMRRESSVSFAMTSSAKAQALAESGIILAQYNLSRDDPEQRWLVDGTIYEVLGPESRMRIRVLSESGKVDINASGEEQLAAVLKFALDDDWRRQQLLNAILDWRDADDDTRAQGAERRQYKQAGLSYAPNNAAFQSLEELQLVLGMNEAIYNAIQPFITVYSGEATVNQRDASPELLAILAADLKQRNIHDESLQKLLQAGGEQNAQAADAEQAGISENQTYTIVVEARVQREASASLEAVVQYQGQGNQNGSHFVTLDWKHNFQASSLFNPTMEYPVITVQDEFRYGDHY